MPEKLKNYNDKKTTDGWPTDTLYDFSNYIFDSNVFVLLTSDKFHDEFKENYNHIPRLYNAENEFNRYFVTSKNYEVETTDKSILYSNYNSIDKATLPIYYFNEKNNNSIVVSIDDLFKLYNYNSLEFDTSSFNEETLKEFSKYYAKYYTLSRSEALKIANSNHTNVELNNFKEKYLDYYNLETELNILNLNPELNQTRINEILETDTYKNFINDENKDDYYDYINNLGKLSLDADYYTYLELTNYYRNPLHLNTYILAKIAKSGKNNNYITDEEKEFNINILNEYIKKSNIDFNINLKINNDSDPSSVTLNKKISGYYILPTSETFYVTGVYVNQNEAQMFEKSYYQTEKTNYKLENSTIYYTEILIPTTTSHNIFT
jgi:hypothetical protein